MPSAWRACDGPGISPIPSGARSRWGISGVRKVASARPCAPMSRYCSAPLLLRAAEEGARTGSVIEILVLRALARQAHLARGRCPPASPAWSRPVYPHNTLQLGAYVQREPWINQPAATTKMIAANTTATAPAPMSIATKVSIMPPIGVTSICLQSPPPVRLTPGTLASSGVAKVLFIGGLQTPGQPQSCPSRAAHQAGQWGDRDPGLSGDIGSVFVKLLPRWGHAGRWGGADRATCRGERASEGADRLGRGWRLPGGSRDSPRWL